MINWTKGIKHGIRANSFDDDMEFVDLFEFKNNELISNLSPITNFLFNVWTVALQNNKNVILSFPSINVNSVTLLAYLYINIKHRSVLIFSKGGLSTNSISSKHNKYFFLLSWSGSDFLYEDVPIGFIDNNGNLNSKIVWPHSKNSYRKNNKERIKNNLVSTNKPKILLNDGDNLTKINKTLESIVFDEETLNENSINLDIGCVIFEDADKYICDNFKAKKFIEWVNNYDDNVIFLFHFSNSNFKLLSKFKESTNSILVPFTNDILRFNNEIINSSIKYFDDKRSKKNLLNNYNLDNKSIYTFKYNLNIIDPTINKGNLDLLYNSCKECINDIDRNSIKNEILLGKSINLLNSLCNTFINPIDLTFKFNFGFGWRYVSVKTFIDIFWKKIHEESKNNQLLLKYYLEDFNNFFQELYRTREFNVNKSYGRIGKEYKLIEILSNQEDYFDNVNKVLVGVYFDTEVNLLKNKLDFLANKNPCLNFDNVEIIYLKNLFKKDINFNKYNLVLPGTLPKEFISVLRLDFKQVLFVCFDGRNRNFTQHQINSILIPSIENEKIAMDYFKEIYDIEGLSKNNCFFNDFHKRYFELKNSTDSQDLNEAINKEDSNYKNDNKNLFDFQEIKEEYDKFIKDWKPTNLDSTVVIDKNIEESNEKNNISFVLLNLSNNIQINKKLIYNKKYLKFKNISNLEDNIEEVKPKFIEKNDYIVVLDSNDSFSNIFIKLFNLNENIDYESADYWKDAIISYVGNENLSNEEFYNLYKKNGGPYKESTIKNWLKGKTIAPQKKEALYYLAITIKDNYLLNNYNEIYDEARKIRRLNRKMGHKLRFIIKTILSENNSLNFEKMGFEEQVMYDMIKDSIYKVIDIL